ncbi:MAG TPA: hypothetical protein VH062_36790 [Polyangiaceae bacterium]|nr:hypothetical protein [Polyangiaceae bacterium]
MSDQNDSNTGNGGGSSFDDTSSFAVAYEKRLQEIRSVPDDELVTMNFDVHSAITTVLGVLPELVALREAMAALAGLDQGKISGLEEYAQAAAEANSRYVTATLPPEDIVAMNEQAMAMRETFRSDATALANRGLIARERLTAFKGLVGYKNVAFDLIDWANLMRDCWAQIQGKTALSAAEIQQGKELGERLVRAAGIREQAPAVAADAALVRQQALTLLLNAYDETRRAVVYLRWHPEDAETSRPRSTPAKCERAMARSRRRRPRRRRHRLRRLRSSLLRRCRRRMAWRRAFLARSRSQELERSWQTSPA